MKNCESELDFVDFFLLASDAGPKDSASAMMRKACSTEAAMLPKRTAPIVLSTVTNGGYRRDRRVDFPLRARAEAGGLEAGWDCARALSRGPSTGGPPLVAERPFDIRAFGWFIAADSNS
ncbi:MAG: hypothetical protein DLM68_12690 [Hyphomicrobiales bacterium]|nr:MAG: hypothetical protein DLM68_12690 [Hyphomicrobiales bacterium]